MTPHAFKSLMRTYDDGKLAVAFLQIREGEIAADAEPDELGDGQGWIYRAPDGTLLRVDVFGPVPLDLMRRVAGDDAAAAEFLTNAVPADFIAIREPRVGPTATWKFVR